MTDNNTKPYLMNRKCEGKAGSTDLKAFRVPQLKKISIDLGLSPVGRKDELCQRIRDHLSKNPSAIETLTIPDYNKPKTVKKTTVAKKAVVKKPSTEKTQTANVSASKIKKYETLQEMLKDHKINNLRSLIELNDEELEALINIIKLHEGTIEMKDLLKDVSDENEKITIFITEMAKKLCRCIEKIGQSEAGKKLEEQQKIAMCIKSIFHTKKIPGVDGITISRFQCEPTPMFIPAEDSTFVIRKLSQTK